MRTGRLKRWRERGLERCSRAQYEQQGCHRHECWLHAAIRVSAGIKAVYFFCSNATAGVPERAEKGQNASGVKCS